MKDFILNEETFLNTDLNNGNSTAFYRYNVLMLCIKCAFINALEEAPIELPTEKTPEILTESYSAHMKSGSSYSRNTYFSNNWNELASVLDGFETHLRNVGTGNPKQFLKDCLDELKDKKLIKTKLQYIQEISERAKTEQKIELPATVCIDRA